MPRTPADDPPDPGENDLSGRLVGSSYVLISPVGQGATGTVWRGLESATGDQVAVKLLHDGQMQHPLVQERSILRLVRHEHVVGVRELFSVGGSLGLAMDFVAGGSLRDRLRRDGPFAPAEAARLLAQVAAALAVAHEHGVVHRDVKPDNILLSEGERPDIRLTDFGIATMMPEPPPAGPLMSGNPMYLGGSEQPGGPMYPGGSEQPGGPMRHGGSEQPAGPMRHGGSEQPGDPRQSGGSGESGGPRWSGGPVQPWNPGTGKATVVGTPHYMAPEAISGGEADPAADVYALGVVLFELITGRTPFAGADFEVLRAHLDDRPRRPVGIPDEVWAVVARCLDKDPARRPAAVTLRGTLTRLSGSLAGLPAMRAPIAAPPRQTPPPAPRQRPRERPGNRPRDWAFLRHPRK